MEYFTTKRRLYKRQITWYSIDSERESKISKEKAGLEITQVLFFLCVDARGVNYMDQFSIIHGGDHFVIINVKGERRNHTHIKKRGTCQLLIRLVYRKQVPRSSYLRESAKRITLDTDYIKRIDETIEQDKVRKGERSQDNV